MKKIALQAGVGDREVESGQWEMGDFRSAAGSSITLLRKSTDLPHGCCPVCSSLPDTDLDGVTSSLVLWAHYLLIESYHVILSPGSAF